MLSKRYSLGNISGIMDPQHTGAVRGGGRGGHKKCFTEEAEETQF